MWPDDATEERRSDPIILTTDSEKARIGAPTLTTARAAGGQGPGMTPPEHHSSLPHGVAAHPSHGEPPMSTPTGPLCDTHNQINPHTSPHKAYRSSAPPRSRHAQRAHGGPPPPTGTPSGQRGRCGAQPQKRRACAA